jgi:hypothetical protein
MKLFKNLDSESRKEALFFLFYVLYPIVIFFCICLQEKYLEGTILPGDTFGWVCITGSLVFSIINFLCINWYVKAKSIVSGIVVAVSSIILAVFLIPVYLVCVLKLNSICVNHDVIVKYYKVENKYEHIRSGRDIIPGFSCYSMFDLETGQPVSLYLLPKRKFERPENYIAIKCYKGTLGWYKLKRPFLIYKLNVNSSIDVGN